MLLALLLALQTTPVAPIVRGTALPPPGSEEAAVLAPIERLFAAMKAKDAPRIMAEVRADGRATGVTMQADGSSTISSSGWNEFATRFRAGPGPVLDEQLVGQPAIEIDGDMAMVWSAYTFRIDGKLSHCGTDHVDLVREKGRWQIANITWTQRTTGCS